MAYDVRAVANFILDVADEENLQISNLHINKVIFFLHADFLVMFSRPLVSAKIEAWTYGPVFREIYREFKSHGNNPISNRAQYLDPVTGDRKIAQCTFSHEELIFVIEQTKKYIAMSPSTLVEQSHIKDGPWDQAWNHETPSNASMRISDEHIKSWYGRTIKH